VSCADPHPVRGADGIAIADELEVIGGHATEVWARCRTCGAWYWLSTDVGGKYEYVGAVALDAKLAERALVTGDLDAIAEMLDASRVPHGPVWTTASALVEIFVALTPGATAAARATALGSHARDPLRRRAAELFASQARGEARARPADLAFAIDVPLPAGTWTAYEVGASIVLLADGQAALLRLDASGLVQLPLAGAPRLLARRPDAIVMAVSTANGDGTLVLDAAGTATGFPPSATSYEVTPIDGGWWQFVSDGSVELRLADGTPRVKLPRRVAAGARWMPPARRFAGGWIVPNLVDDDGHAQALTLFDDQFATVAHSTQIDGDRRVTPIDESSLWAITDGAVERWVVRGRHLERVQELEVRTAWHAGGQLVCDHGRGTITAYGPDGAPRWSGQRELNGALYAVPTRDGVLIYDDVEAQLIDRHGFVEAGFAVESPDVAVGRGGTVFLKSTDQLWVIDASVRTFEVDLAAHLLTTCGERALLAVAEGRFEQVASDGARAGFTAPGARFSVIGTRGGPYVVEPSRLRVAGFA